MRVMVEPGRPALITLSTDGYANSFATDEGFLQIGGDYLEMVRKEPDKLADGLQSILTEATEQGSSDDITLALLYWAKPESRKRNSASWFWRTLVAVLCTLLLAAWFLVLPLLRVPPLPPSPRAPVPPKAAQVP
jgi:hypothetical protein